MVERPDSADAIELISQLDAYLASPYPAESRHGLSIEALLDPGVTFLLARLRDQAVGCGGVKALEPGIGEVKRMYVLPAVRGHGIAKKILAGIESVALRLDLKILRLETGIYQPEALGLYKACGFHEIPPFADYKPDPLCVYFEKNLAERRTLCIGEKGDAERTSKISVMMKRPGVCRRA